MRFVCTSGKAGTRAMWALAASLTLSIAVALGSCSGGNTGTGTADKGVLTVSILPQAFVVQRIAGDDFTVNTLVGEGQSPHSWEPTPRQMADLAGTAVWFRIGVDFENGFAPKVAAMYPNLKTVDVTRGITYRLMEAHSHQEEEGHEGEDSPHEGEEHTGEDEHHSDQPGTPDLHVWLGEANTISMAAMVRDTLIDLYPGKADTFRANHDALVADVRSTFATLKADLADLRGQTAYVFHPAFGYLLDDLGLRQEAVETGGKEPSQKGLAELISRARRDGVKTIFVQTQFPAAAATTLAESLGGAVIPLDPLAPNLLDNLRYMGEALKHGIKK